MTGPGSKRPAPLRGSRSGYTPTGAGRARLVPGLIELEVAVPPPEPCRAVGTRVIRQEHHEEETAVRKSYQNEGLDTRRPAVPTR